MKRFKNILGKVQGYSYIGQLCVFILLMYSPIIVLIPFVLIILIFMPGFELPDIPDHGQPDVLAVLILAPLIETFIAQYLSYKIFKYFRIFNVYVYLILTSVFFGLMHGNLQLLHIVHGGVLTSIFLFYSDTKRAFWTTVFVHFTYNVFAILARYFYGEYLNTI